jgi:hypothetical protein
MTPELDDAAVARLLASRTAKSVASLSEWLEANPKTWVATVERLAEEPSRFSAEASCAVLEAMAKKNTIDEMTTLRLVKACLVPITARIQESLDRTAPGSRGRTRVSGGNGSGGQDDPLVRTAVGIVTASRRAKLSKGAIGCLADAGPAGALVLTRAFDAVRGGTKVLIMRSINAPDVLSLGDNEVVSLASSVARFAVELVGQERADANRFLAELGPVETRESAQIDPTEPLALGQLVFHATWGAGTVVASDPSSVTVDFGNAGKRTLLRAYATLRHA